MVKMKPGDLVKHMYGTIQGTGIIIGYADKEMIYDRVTTLWTFPNQTKQLVVATRYLEVISESR